MRAMSTLLFKSGGNRGHGPLLQRAPTAGILRFSLAAFARLVVGERGTPSQRKSNIAEHGCDGADEHGAQEQRLPD